MNRREAVKRVLRIAGGALLAPGCATLADETQFWYTQLFRETVPSLNDPEIVNALYQGKYRGERHGVLDSIETFQGLPYKHVAEYLQLSQRDEVTILYPGAGSHLSPLEIAVQLAKQTPTPPRFTFIFTEVQEEKAEEFEELVGRMRRFGVEITRKRGVPQTKGKDIHFQLSGFGSGIEIVYRINRSDKSEGNHPYFRREDFNRADIILFHDSFFSSGEIIPNLFYCLNRSVELSRRQVFIFEDTFYTNSFDLPAPSDDERGYDILPGTVHLTRGEFGCFASGYADAVTYFPDKDGLKKRLQDPRFEEEIYELDRRYALHKRGWEPAAEKDRPVIFQAPIPGQD